MRTPVRLGIRPLLGIAILTASAAALAQEPEVAQPQDEELRVALAASPAQSPPSPTWNQVRIIRVKGDQVPAFEATLRELGAAMAKQGRAFNVWQMAFGEQNTYHLVSQLDSFASLPQLEADPPMEQAQWRSWLERMRSTIDSQVVAVAQVHPDLSIMPQQPSPAATGAELLVLVSSTVLPGKRQEYVSWLREQLLPAFRKSSIAGVVSNEMAFGSSSREWVFAVPVQSWAELDEPMPLFEAMGQQSAEELLARGDALVAQSEIKVLRSRPDLSAAVQAAP